LSKKIVKAVFLTFARKSKHPRMSFVQNGKKVENPTNPTGGIHKPN
jgi:hypothetical protein